MYWPPLMVITAPVMKPACVGGQVDNGLPAISSGLPSRPTGMLPTMDSRTFSGMAATMSVLM
jgi:hypothetical protein